MTLSSVQDLDQLLQNITHFYIFKNIENFVENFVPRWKIERKKYRYDLVKSNNESVLGRKSRRIEEALISIISRSRSGFVETEHREPSLR